MADLENLRSIDCFELSIPDIGRMPWLQTLSNFTVKKEKGYEIMQLENLNNIHGELTIQGLGNIESKEDARRANLSKKLRVSSLGFYWAPNEDEDEEMGWSSSKKQKTAAHNQQVVTPPKPEEILEALHPPALLEKLSITSYDGSTFPSWLSGEDGSLKHLKLLDFFCCDGSGSRLRTLELPGLHKLKIVECSWKSLPDNIKQLASLKELIIIRCENIKSPPELPSSLKILRMRNCPNVKTLPELPPSLEKLECEQYLVDSYPDRQAIERIEIEIWP